MIKAVLFDMDGLMIDSEPIAERAWKETFRELGYELSDALNLKMIGRNVPDSNEILMQAMGSDFPVDRCRSMANDRYVALFESEGIPLKPGLIELLTFLKNRRIPLAVATSTPRFLALRKLAQTGLDSWFSAIVAGDEIEKGKPAPDLFLAAAGRIGAAPAHCLVLEDSPAGIEAAAAAGMIPIMVPDLVEPDSPTRSMAYRVVPTLHQVQQFLEQHLDNQPSASLSTKTLRK